MGFGTAGGIRTPDPLFRRHTALSAMALNLSMDRKCVQLSCRSPRRTGEWGALPAVTLNCPKATPGLTNRPGGHFESDPQQTHCRPRRRRNQATLQNSVHASPRLPRIASIALRSPGHEWVGRTSAGRRSGSTRTWDVPSVIFGDAPASLSGRAESPFQTTRKVPSQKAVGECRSTLHRPHRERVAACFGGSPRCAPR